MSMINLLQETIYSMHYFNKTFDDVMCIRNSVGNSCTVEMFKLMSDVYYDPESDMGVLSDLVIVFVDKSYLRRNKQDKMSYWEYIPSFKWIENDVLLNTLFETVGNKYETNSSV